MQQEIGDEDNEDDRQHDLCHQIAEAANAAGEFRLRQLTRHRVGDRREFGSACGGDDEGARRTAPHGSAGEDTVETGADLGFRRRDAGSLGDRKGLAGQCCLADIQISRRQDHRIRRHETASRKTDDVARHDRRGRDCPFSAVAQHGRRQRYAFPQGFDGTACPIFLGESEQAACEDDAANDQCIVQFPNACRDDGGKDQDEDERTDKLLEQRAERIRLAGGIDGICNIYLQPRFRFRRCEAGGLRLELSKKLRQRQRPVGPLIACAPVEIGGAGISRIVHVAAPWIAGRACPAHRLRH